MGAGLRQWAYDSQRVRAATFFRRIHSASAQPNSRQALPGRLREGFWSTARRAARGDVEQVISRQRWLTFRWTLRSPAPRVTLQLILPNIYYAQYASGRHHGNRWQCSSAGAFLSGMSAPGPGLGL